MSSLQVPELRLPAGDGGGGAGSGTGSKGTAPLLLVPPSNVPRRRHSWICRISVGLRDTTFVNFRASNRKFRLSTDFVKTFLFTFFGIIVSLLVYDKRDALPISCSLSTSQEETTYLETDLRLTTTARINANLCCGGFAGERYFDKADLDADQEKVKKSMLRYRF
ncbi:hypothetical protein V1478_009278 [Vespula squamosa]|uniref:Uncharacterized protein n=1 Tax=Vespula squamosa TaxID=30214 RepID=A0ABD2API0_VESSQ